MMCLHPGWNCMDHTEIAHFGKFYSWNTKNTEIHNRLQIKKLGIDSQRMVEHNVHGIPIK